MRNTLPATVWPAFPALLFALLLASCSAPVETVEVVRMEEAPGDGVFRLARMGLQVRVADFGNALYEDELGYPRLDFGKFDREQPGEVLRTFAAVVLENKYIRLTLLPGKGKPYSFVYKVTGREEFFIPAVAQALGSPNKLASLRQPGPRPDIHAPARRPA